MFSEGRQVRAARAILGLSQEELARLAQIHRNSLSSLEAGEGSGPSVAERLSIALDASGSAFESDHQTGMIRYPLTSFRTGAPPARSSG
jgi:transcriptional regulator with XRE-family HTH domain